ncbi:DUF554 domain-containing protein [Heliophilum fasciatum]|uniref:DUF554 domain-containing protein n=1 Tax=Heliophilum fasciatum TaxID=35700 RepID=A0A4V2SXZ8_9FIRM|nr:DUF554 domain-containing protein [Heliophilum fasciatum]MCW2277239.1 putative membrane protein YqgA involved in biofilm formation [Heliophilum fasciatum]TCP68126.1 hypothetical protein EDD73_10428 [Heliophilum fasciatum]
MLGTLVNTLAIIIGGTLGLWFGHAVPEKMKETVLQGLGLAVLLIGGSMALKTNNVLVVIGALVIGGMIGEFVDIEQKLKNFGHWVENKIARGEDGRFTKAFVSTSLIYCVGAMAIMGSIESGVNGDHRILMVKSLLDGISSIVFASSLGIGVLASAIPVFLYQGAITLAAGLLQTILSSSIITEMSATGGLLIVGIGLTMLEIKEIKVGNLLPAIFVAIPLSALVTRLNI